MRSQNQSLLEIARVTVTFGTLSCCMPWGRCGACGSKSSALLLNNALRRLRPFLSRNPAVMSGILNGAGATISLRRSVENSKLRSRPQLRSHLSCQYNAPHRHYISNMFVFRENVMCWCPVLVKASHSCRQLAYQTPLLSAFPLKIPGVIPLK